MVSFDLYPKAIADGSSHRASGDVVDLEGIDGFFDEYFAGRENGDIIHFVNTAPPGEWPTQFPALVDLPFFSAQIVENNYDWARVRLLEISTLGDWSLSRDERPGPLNQLSLPVTMPTDLVALIEQAQRRGFAYWHSGAEHWRSLSEVTAIGVLAGDDSLGLWVLTTNAAPSYFARVIV